MQQIDADSIIKDIVELIRLADELERESYEKKDEIGLKYARDTRLSFMALLSRVEEASTVEQEMRYGQWIDNRKDKYICSACKGYVYRWFGKSDFCPRCGAKMSRGGVGNVRTD